MTSTLSCGLSAAAFRDKSHRFSRMGRERERGREGAEKKREERLDGEERFNGSTWADKRHRQTREQMWDIDIDLLARLSRNTYGFVVLRTLKKGIPLSFYARMSMWVLPELIAAE